MIRSTDRIRTTHVGSIPRPPALFTAMKALDDGSSKDRAAFEALLTREINGIVKKQVELGIDTVSDGEFSKTGFSVYANTRLGGYTAQEVPRVSPWSTSREALAFPEFYGQETRVFAGTVASRTNKMICTGPVTYIGGEQLKRDLANLKTAVAASGAT